MYSEKKIIFRMLDTKKSYLERASVISWTWCRIRWTADVVMTVDYRSNFEI